MRAQDYAMFRKNTAMISITCPYIKEEGENSAVLMFMNGAKFNATTSKMDWEGRVIIKLDANDCGELLHGLKNNRDVNLFHQAPNKPAKTINLSFHDGKVSLAIAEKKEGGDNKVFVNLNPGEYEILIQLLGNSIPKLLAWA